MWVLSRTVGLVGVPEAGRPESVGVADAVSTALEAAMVVTIVGLVAWPAVRLRQVPLSTSVVSVGTLMGLVAFLTVPAIVAAPDHDHGQHSHGDVAGHDNGAAHDAMAAHDDEAGRDDEAAHDDDADHRDDRMIPGSSHHGEFGHTLVPCDEPVTDEQVSAAYGFASATEDAVRGRYDEPADAEAAGYVLATPPGVPVPHYAKVSYLRDGIDLDPERPESLVYAKAPDGRTELIGVMYVDGIWVAEVDPDTGLLVEDTSSRIADGAAPLRRTFNGPEFGVDRAGWSLYYTRLVDGRQQVARVTADGTLAVLTTGDEHFSPLASTQASSASTRLIALRRPPDWGTALWVDAADPGTEHELLHLAERTDGDARWAVGTATFVTNAHPDQPGRLSLVNTDTGAVVPVSEPGVKTAPNAIFAWVAPEADGELFLLAVVDDRELVVWGRHDHGDWQRRATLTSPDPTHPYLGSPEPFVAGGRSYISLTTAEAPGAAPGRTSQQVWIVGIDPEAPFERRCDDGEAGPVTRVDPEVLLGADQAFVYYYTLTQAAGAQTYRCATGIRP